MARKKVDLVMHSGGVPKQIDISMTLPEAQALIAAAQCLDREGYESRQQESYLNWVATRIEKAIQERTGGIAPNPPEDDDYEEDDVEENPNGDDDDDDDDGDDDDDSGYRYV